MSTWSLPAASLPSRELEARYGSRRISFDFFDSSAVSRGLSVPALCLNCLMDQRLVDALEATVVALRGAPVGADSLDGSLLSRAQAVAALVECLEVDLSATLAEIDRRALSEADCGMRTAAWFSHVTRAPRSRCNQLLRVGRCRNEALTSAVHRGELSTHQAGVVLRVTNPNNALFMESITDQLIELGSAASDFESFAKLVTDIANRADTEGREPQSEDSRLFLNRVADCVVVKATLYGDDASVVQHVLNDVANELFHQHATAGVCAPRAQLMAKALSQTCSRSRVVEHGLKPKTHAVVVIDKNTDSQLVNSALLCDADIELLHTDGHIPLQLERVKRFPSSAQRRVIHIRDGGCVFPGCRASPHIVDIHHVVPWNHGGATNVEQLASLCRTHHGITHSRGWTMSSTPNGFRWITPTGNTLLSQRHGVMTKPPP